MLLWPWLKHWRHSEVLRCCQPCLPGWRQPPEGRSGLWSPWAGGSPATCRAPLRPKPPILVRTSRNKGDRKKTPATVRSCSSLARVVSLWAWVADFWSILTLKRCLRWPGRFSDTTCCLCAWKDPRQSWWRRSTVSLQCSSPRWLPWRGSTKKTPRYVFFIMTKKGFYLLTLWHFKKVKYASFFILPYENITILNYVWEHINCRQRIAALENLHFIAITIKRHVVNYALPPFLNLSVQDHMTSLNFPPTGHWDVCRCCRFQRWRICCPRFCWFHELCRR